MIDLHSHILPGVDDGAQSLDVALGMARIAVSDGIELMACTPHFMPGVYDNEAEDIRRRIDHLRGELRQSGIALELVTGSDAHIRPDFLDCLRSNRILTLNDSRYVLFEPPHNILPQRLDDLLHNILVAGYVPILTHPERLRWVENHYSLVEDLARQGVWMQITAGSLTGHFGKRAHYWSHRMLAEGLISILASDAHGTDSRPPRLAEARDLAAAELGSGEAENLVVLRPQCIIENAPADVSPPLPTVKRPVVATEPLWRRLFMSGS